MARVDGRTPSWTRWGFGLAAVVVVLSLAVSLFGAVKNLTLRPLDGVEGDALFEASRIRAGLALYVDPVAGARDYGPIPARYYVLYPPLWPWLLSHVPAPAAPLAARGFSIVAFWGLLGWIAASAEPRCRRVGAVAAAFVGGVFALAEFGGSGRPDSLALLLAGVGLVRSLERGRVDAWAAALFAFAAWTKPNVVGMASGAMLATLARDKWRAWGALLAALSVSAFVAGILQVVSHGAWLTHLLLATGQPLRPSLLLAHMHRAQFFAAPLAFAAFCAWRARSSAAGALGLWAIVTSIVWALLTFAKTGSAANYWLEPCIASAAFVARVPLPSLPVRAVAVAAVAAPFQALWTDVASVRATFEAFAANERHMELVARARELCSGARDGLVVSDEPGVELMLDGGRIVEHTFPLSHAGLRGKYPLGPWIADLSRPEIACVLTLHDRIERPPTEVDLDYDYFALPVRTALAARFAPALRADGWTLYLPR